MPAPRPGQSAPRPGGGGETRPFSPPRGTNPDFTSLNFCHPRTRERARGGTPPRRLQGRSGLNPSRAGRPAAAATASPTSSLTQSHFSGAALLGKARPSTHIPLGGALSELAKGKKRAQSLERAPEPQAAYLDWREGCGDREKPSRTHSSPLPYPL